MMQKTAWGSRPLLVLLPTLLGIMLFASSGCSVYMAAKQPGKKDLAVLKTGTPRSHVIAELGQPVFSEIKNGAKADVFAFRQGYSSGVKAGRAFIHGVADVFTLGLWEVVGTPVESVATGSDLKLQVLYDESDLVQSYETIGPKEKEAEHNK
ncbi:MAG TPA: hypothetical protein VF790_06390 [Dissulfurispiraceae bacterium]